LEAAVVVFVALRREAASAEAQWAALIAVQPFAADMVVFIAVQPSAADMVVFIVARRSAGDTAVFIVALQFAAVCIAERHTPLIVVATIAARGWLELATAIIEATAVMAIIDEAWVGDSRLLQA
jgi:hypothetical protein